MKTKAQTLAANSSKRMLEREFDITYGFSTVGNTIKYFQDLLKDPRFNENSIVNVAIDHNYGDETAVVKVYYEEEETDREFAERIRSEADREKWQKRQYEELKKKFG